MIKEIRREHNELRQFVKWYNELQIKNQDLKYEILINNVDKNFYIKKLKKITSKKNKSFKLFDFFFFSDGKNLI